MTNEHFEQERDPHAPTPGDDESLRETIKRVYGLNWHPSRDGTTSAKDLTID